jgi:hypothetical protein
MHLLTATPFTLAAIISISKKIQSFLMEFPDSLHLSKKNKMGKTTNLLTLFLFAFLFGTIAWGQNLTPQELLQINNNSDFTTITSTLVVKGWKLHSSSESKITKETSSSWYFHPFAEAKEGERVNSYLIKSVDSTQKAQTLFLLHNSFHYKDFINNLIKSKFKFTGVQIIEDKTYSVFTKKGIMFLTTEKKDSDNKNYYEIRLQKG